MVYLFGFLAAYTYIWGISGQLSLTKRPLEGYTIQNDISAFYNLNPTYPVF